MFTGKIHVDSQTLVDSNNECFSNPGILMDGITYELCHQPMEWKLTHLYSIMPPTVEETRGFRTMRKDCETLLFDLRSSQEQCLI